MSTPVVCSRRDRGAARTGVRFGASSPTLAVPQRAGPPGVTGTIRFDSIRFDSIRFDPSHGWLAASLGGLLLAGPVFVYLRPP